MTKTLDVSVKTQEEARNQAAAAWKVSPDELSVELLERGKSGFLGIGSTLPKYRVTWETEDPQPVPLPVAPAPAPAPAKTQAAKPAPAPKPVSAAKASTEEEKVRAFLEGLFAHMGVSADIAITPGEENGLNVELNSQDVGSLIGRRGETLDAIQHLVNYALNKNGGHTRVTVDAENYRAKREESLRKLAVKMGAKVARYRRSMTLEPMNAYERHIIHITLQDYEHVTTYSAGTEPNRRVVVSYDRDKQGKPLPTSTDDDRPQGGNRPDRGARRDYGDGYKSDRGEKKPRPEGDQETEDRPQRSDRRDRNDRGDRRGRRPDRGRRTDRDETRLVRQPGEEPDYSANLAKAKKPDSDIREWG